MKTCGVDLYLHGKTILITGGTGSFGRLITKELLKKNPREIRIYSRDEEKQFDMERELHDDRIKFVIGDVRDHERLLEATVDVHVLYHAAALKMVPTCELNPVEALKTNTVGTLNVKNAAINNQVEKSILVSTDKAVKPVGAYGIAKAAAEKIWLNDYFKVSSKFAVVRYGNVIGSRGSIIPYFKDLISQKKSLVITDPEMTRFFIAPQAVADLVFYATRKMQGGEIYVPKIPSCSIIDLAKAMGGENYPLETIGIRAGERLHEYLMEEDEFRRAKETRKYYIICQGNHMTQKVKKDLTSQNARKLTVKEIESLLERSNA